jgi:NAD(P)-dependent dehydrogenase (short-subunit alcohol dehydrogenase family)
MGEPKSIVDAVLFAIKNDYVNGTVLEIDGGLTL